MVVITMPLATVDGASKPQRDGNPRSSGLSDDRVSAGRRVVVQAQVGSFPRPPPAGRNWVILSTIARAPLRVVGVAACVLAVIGLLARYVPITSHFLLAPAVSSPYLMLAAPLVLPVLLIGKRWIVAGVTGVLTVALLAVRLPSYVGSGTDTEDHVSLRVLSANLYEGHADVQTLMQWAREHADVVAVQEMTPEAMQRLSALDALFPYRAVVPKAEASGAGLWSRYPLNVSALWGDFQMSYITAHLAIPGVRSAPTMSVVHSPAPWPWPIDTWRHSMDSLAASLQQAADSAGAGAVVVAGDFNSTLDMLQFRRLLQNGYDDAAEQAGAGFAPTYPGDSHVPPLMTIDHVLTRMCTATSARTVTIPGSDHRALLVTVEIPRDPTAS
jgi:endonuclease/exonuclease/phosphatase (EEP) superfamily protein YafD